jgi:hypothetical protein
VHAARSRRLAGRGVGLFVHFSSNRGCWRTDGKGVRTMKANASSVMTPMSKNCPSSPIGLTTSVGFATFAASTFFIFRATGVGRVPMQRVFE